MIRLCYIIGKFDFQLIGHRQSRRDMVESYENYDRVTRTNRSEPRQWSNSGTRDSSRLTAGI